MQRIIGIGSALMDVLALVPEQFLSRVPGEKGGMELLGRGEADELLSRLPAASRVPGGSAANTVVGAAHLGLHARILTKIGSDEAGRFYRTAITDAGVETQAFKVHPSEATGFCISLVTPDSQRTMRTHLGASATLSPEEITVDDFAECTLAHMEGYMLFDENLALHVLETAKAAGCMISLDLASPEVVRAGQEILPRILREYVDMVFANEDEAAVFAQTQDEDAALSELAALCPLAAVKLGARGSMIRRGDERVTVPACGVDAVDTIGAGDLWASGFLYGLLTGRSLPESGRIASRVAAAVVQQVGALIPEEEWRQIGVELR